MFNHPWKMRYLLYFERKQGEMKKLQQVHSSVKK